MTPSGHSEKDEDLVKALHEHIMKEQERKQKKEYADWREVHAKLPSDYAPQLKPGFVADIELQPMRWMRSGLELIESAKGTTSIQLFDGKKGSPMQTYLPYPVFQAATEIFLKGMLLAQHENCRVVEASDYVPPETRKEYYLYLKKLGHDLLGIISELQQIKLYSEEENISDFLKIISGVTRRYYFPLTEDDKAWGHARYPRRFYDDTKADGHADGLKSYPEQWPLVLLFQDMISRVDRLWGITEGLAKRAKEGSL
jgi:hypothetical protein